MGCSKSRVDAFPYESIYDVPLITISGEESLFGEYRGKIVLIVNIAEKCGYTSQLSSMESLYERFKDKDFVVIGFPSDDFLHQTPGNNSHILEFCQMKHGVKFPLNAKCHVRGKEIHPLFLFLTQKATNPKFYGNISWNFNKFLISKSGDVVNRFGSVDEPEAALILDAITKEIEKEDKNETK